MSIFNAISSGDANEVMRLLNTDPSLLEGVDMSGGAWGDRMTPLIHAAKVGQLEIVKLLTGKGADIHATTSRSETALHCAAERGYEEVVVYLLNKGAQPSHQDRNGIAPLMLAARMGRARVALRLLEHMGGQGLEVKCQYEGRTALHFAVCRGRLELVAILLNRGARAGTTSRNGTSALQTAVERGHVEIVKLLVDHLGPQVLHEVDPRRGSLLHIALYWESEEMVMYLLSTGAWPTVRDGRGETALMCGAMCASITVLRRLLEHTAGQELNDRSSAGRTALHCAVLYSRHDNLRALLLAGADPTIVDHDESSRTPRQWAEEFKHRTSIAVFKWWDGELERGSVLYRARALHDTYEQHEEVPTRPVPGFLEARVVHGRALPRVEVVVGQQNGVSWDGSRKRTRAATKAHATEEQQCMHAVMGWAVNELSEELFTELMQGFSRVRQGGLRRTREWRAMGI